jgi:hypothetical protein
VTVRNSVAAIVLVSFFLLTNNPLRTWERFRSTQDTIREIDYCNNNYKDRGCSYNYDEKLQVRHKVNEHSPSQLISSQSVIFEVNMADFQSKVMTYRASIKPSQVSRF